MELKNIFESIPDKLTDEFFELLIHTDSVKVERIVSKGHSSPATDWYDQAEHEWVMVLKGAAELMFENDLVIQMKAGDHINILAHTRHRVSWTKPDEETIWLAVFYRAGNIE